MLSRCSQGAVVGTGQGAVVCAGRGVVWCAQGGAVASCSICFFCDGSQGAGQSLRLQPLPCSLGSTLQLLPAYRCDNIPHVDCICPTPAQNETGHLPRLRSLIQHVPGEVGPANVAGLLRDHDGTTAHDADDHQLLGETTVIHEGSLQGNMEAPFGRLAPI